MEKSQKQEKEILKLYHSNNEKQIDEILKSDLKIPIHKFANQKHFTGNWQYSEKKFQSFAFGLSPQQFRVDLVDNKRRIGKIHQLIEQRWIHSSAYGIIQRKFSNNYIQQAKEIIKLLLQEGANQDVRNNTGLTVLHMSVQGDHVKASLFWINRGIPIDIQDAVNQTPLICASFLGSQQIVNFLIPWGAKLNSQTKDKGYSALHVATIQGHSRIVRKLLIKGIDRKLRDKNGKTALDLAIESKFSTIQAMIENKMGFLERLGLRQPHSKVTSNYKSLSFYLTLYCTSFLFTVIFSFPFMDSLQIWYLIIFILTLLLTYILTKKNPGFLPKTNKPLMDLLENYSAEQICSDCSIIKPARSRHCEICEKCVSRYDHHCPWLCNCIGEKNLYIFITFLFLLLMSMILQIVVQSQVFHIEEEEDSTLIFFKQFTFYYTMIFDCIFIIPVTLLFTFQIYNLIKGQTTYERYLEKQGVNRVQSRKASAEQQLKQLKSNTENNDGEFKLTLKTQKKPLLQETELIM